MELCGPSVAYTPSVGHVTLRHAQAMNRHNRLTKSNLLRRPTLERTVLLLGIL